MTSDRWIEIDLFYYQDKPFARQAREVIDRLEPLYRNATGDGGLMLCCAWLCDVVYEWNGSPDQPVPFRSPSAKKWNGYTYADLRDLIAEIKIQAAAVGLEGFKVGLMVVGWGTFNWGEGGGYDLNSAWFQRHPELYFPDGWKNLDFRKRLVADGQPYASRPDGIKAGTSIADFFAGQWGLVAPFLGLDSIHFRDGFLGPAIYEMRGPFGTRAPADPAGAKEWMEALTGFFKAVKNARPESIVMLYSSARSAIGEYRVGCFDLEAVVASGAIDVWIDQTWGGAWQDWWGDTMRAWTFQLANLITHHLMVVAGNKNRSTPCKHYHLIETWDAWEPWDTLHATPDKLRWGIWAFAHAAVRTEKGLSRTNGAYISWAQNWEGHLLSTDDINFLAKEIDTSAKSADELDEVYGPALTLNPAHLRHARDTAGDKITAGLIDDDCAMLMKWGLPCLSGATLDAAPVSCEGYVLQSPHHLSDAWRKHLLNPATAFIAAGPSQFVDAALLSDIGVADAGEDQKTGKQRLLPIEFISDAMPYIGSVMMPPLRSLTPGKSVELASTAKTVLLARSPNAPHFVWQPPFPFVPSISPLKQSQYGSLAPFAAVVRGWNDACKSKASAWIDDAPFHEPVTFHLWRSGGRVYLLFGNLETGIAGDSRHPRRVRVTLNKSVLKLDGAKHMLREVDRRDTIVAETESEAEASFRFELAPQGSAVFEVVPG